MNFLRRLPGPARVLVVAGLAFVALVAIAWVALVVLLPPARVRAIVERQLSETLARPVRFERASVTLLPPVRLRVDGLALAEPGGFEQGAAVQLGSLALDLDVFALLARRLVVRRLVLDRPIVHLLVRADGTTNFDGLMKPPAAGGGGGGAPAAPPLALAVQDLRVNDGRVLLDRVAARQRVAFGLGTRLGFALDAAGRISTTGRTEISDLAFGPLTATRLSDLNRSLAKIGWTIEHRGKFDAASKRLALDRLALSFGHTALEAQGLVDASGAAPVVDLRARGDNLVLADILHAISEADARAVNGISGAGTLAFDLAIRGALAPGTMPFVTGTARVTGGAFHYAGAPAGVEALSLTAHFAPDSLGIPDLACRVAGQPVRGMLEVRRFADPLVRFSLQGDVDLAAVAPLVAPKDTKLGGRAAVDVRGTGRAKDPAGFALEGHAKLSNVTVASPQLPKPVEAVNGDVAFSAERASVKALTMKAGKSSLALDATVTHPLAAMAKPGTTPPAAVDFTMTSPYLDLAELLPAAGGAAALPNARGAGRVAIGRLKNQKLDVTNVKADVGLEPGVLTVPSFALDGYGGAVRGKARFDLTDPALPAYSVNAAIDSVEADQLLSAWTPLKGLIRGGLNTKLDLSGVGTEPDQIKKSLTAVGLAAFANGQIGAGPALEAISAFTKMPELKDMHFKELKLPFRIERGRMVSNPAHLSGEYGDWIAIGSVGFDGSLDYALSATLPADAVAALSRTSSLAAGALQDENNRILLDLKLTGTTKSPKVSWDPQAMRDRLAGRASKALKEQGAKLTQTLGPALGSGAFSSPESLAKVRESLSRISNDSLKRVGDDLLKSFFGPKKKSAAPTPPPAPPPPAPADTTQK